MFKFICEHKVDMHSRILPFITKSGEMSSNFSYACNLHLFTKACNKNKDQMLLNMATVVILVIW